MQHPSAVKVREEITRLSKRLKPAEKDLEVERKRHIEQQATIKRLQNYLSKIVAGKITLHLWRLWEQELIYSAWEQA